MMLTSDLTKLKLGDAIVQNPITVSPDLPVSQAVILMSAICDRCTLTQQHDDPLGLERLRQDVRSSCLLVVEAGQLLGIFTERDVVRFSSRGTVPLGTTIREVMTSPVVTLDLSKLHDPFVALNLLWKHHIRHLPMVDKQGGIVGIVTHESLRHLLRSEDMLRYQTVFEVMSSEVVTSDASISVLEVSQILADRQVSCVVLVDEHRSEHNGLIKLAVGIITERDIVRFQALEFDFIRLKAADVMSSPLFSVLPEQSLWDVQQIMQRQAVRRILVQGQDGSLQGIITQSSLLNAFSPVDLSRLIERLKQRIVSLENEKIEILERRTFELEQEVTARTHDLRLKVEREQLLASIANDVRASLELGDVLQTAVEKVQMLFDSDRVSIWKMQLDRSVKITAEALGDGNHSNLGKVVLDPCFDAPNWIDAYRQGQTHVVEDIYAHEMADCHRKLLEGLNIRAQIVVPIIQNGELWGMFSVIEGRNPRHWLVEEVRLLRELSVQLAIAIQQAEAYQQAKEELAARRRAEDRIIYNALHDSLTGLPNRNFIVNELTDYLACFQVSELQQYSVLLLDLDRFKIVNDSLGHHAGDELLKIVATMLKASLREEDLAARIGGDEFIVLLRNVDAEVVLKILKRILAAFKSPISLQGREIFVTTSIGVVLTGKQYDSPTALLRDVDIAMYQAKSQGRNGYAIFDEAMYAQALRRLNLERELRQALDQQEFVLHYQPIIALDKQQLAGFEALVRWQHPKLGFISPGEFIPIAEETGLITELTTWVLETACRQLSQWQNKFTNLSNLKMSVNLSVQDLLKKNLPDEIQAVLTRTGLPNRCLTLEVTENLLIENIEVTIAILDRLTDQGIYISIDDFGTGYSSLQYLSYLPCNNLKIDRSFVSGLEAGDRNNQLVKIIVALSDQLSLNSIAEGVETQQQLDWLKSLGCKFAQGYFFSKPLTANEIEQQLQGKYGALLPIAMAECRDDVGQQKVLCH